MWASGPKCPDCDKNYTTDFIDSTFSKGFRRGPLRIASVQNLQEQEMSLLPDTMIVLQERKNIQEYHRLYTEITYLHDFFSNCLASNVAIDYSKYQEDHKKLYESILLYPLRPSGQKRKREAASRSIKCPGQECLGYISLSGIGSGSCALCSMRVCKDCNKSLPNAEAVKAHDKCDPDDVKSWTLIKDTSVGCPKCGTPIQKVSGCNQMWCTVQGCNTAFDWATGRVVNGPFHNPHYHEWLRTAGGANAAQAVGLANANLACQGPGDVISNHNIQTIYGLTDFHQSQLSYYSTNLLQYKKLCVKLSDYLRCLSELVDNRFARRAEEEAYGPNTHQDLRIEYLQKKITKTGWASKLSHRETLRIKYARQRAIYLMFQTAAADLFAQFLTTMRKFAESDETSMKTKSTLAYRSRIIDPQAAYPVIDSFINSIENLRIYHIRESLRIIKDYSDTSIRVMYAHPVADDRTTGVQMYWTLASVKELEEKYLVNDSIYEPI
jgi:hypothetical protein